MMSHPKNSREMFRKWGLKKSLKIKGKRCILWDFHNDKHIAQKIAREAREEGLKTVVIIYRKKAYFEEYMGGGKHRPYFDSVYAVYGR